MLLLVVRVVVAGGVDVKISVKKYYFEISSKKLGKVDKRQRSRAAFERTKLKLKLTLEI